jgi:hypothetical protein
MMTVEKIKQIMPEVADRYKANRPITIRFNPVNLVEQEDVKKFLEANNKFTFKKDALEMLLAIGLELQVQEENGNWVPFRAGHFSFGAGATVTQRKNESEHELYINKVNVGIRKITMIDPTVEDEEERVKEDESGAILGLVNLLIKQNIPKDLPITLPTTKLPELDFDQLKL